MALIYIEQSGIVFELKDGHRNISSIDKTELSGLVFIENSGFKTYSRDINKIAQRVYKSYSTIIDGNVIYYYKAQSLDLFNAVLSPYQILINNFLESKGMSGNTLLLDGDRSAVIISLIIGKDFKQTVVSNAQIIKASVEEIRRSIVKDKIKIDNIVLNDDFYALLFGDKQITIIGETEILEFAQTFDAPVFKKMADIQQKIKVARDKKYNSVLAVSIFIFTIVGGVYLYVSHLNNQYTTLNNNLTSSLVSTKQELNKEIERKFLSTVRVNVSKKMRFILTDISTVPNIKVDNIVVSGSNFTITGNITGGYRSFVKGYNVLLNSVKKIRSKANYFITPTGKTSFTVKGAFK